MRHPHRRLLIAGHLASILSKVLQSLAASTFCTHVSFMYWEDPNTTKTLSKGGRCCKGLYGGTSSCDG